MINSCSECIPGKPAAPLILACKVREPLGTMQLDTPLRLVHTATAMVFTGQLGMSPNIRAELLCAERDQTVQHSLHREHHHIRKNKDDGGSFSSSLQILGEKR